jgi:hypothetical protein
MERAYWACMVCKPRQECDGVIVCQCLHVLQVKHVPRSDLRSEHGLYARLSAAWCSVLPRKLRLTAYDCISPEKACKLTCCLAVTMCCNSFGCLDYLHLCSLLLQSLRCMIHQNQLTCCLAMVSTRSCSPTSSDSGPAPAAPPASSASSRPSVLLTDDSRAWGWSGAQSHQEKQSRAGYNARLW